jgi:hypothetical protein
LTIPHHDDTAKYVQQTVPNRREGIDHMRKVAAGRVIYDMTASFWPAACADESLPDYMRKFGGIRTDKPKVLVSRTHAARGAAGN